MLKTQKRVLDAALLNTQHYKVRIKGKVEQSREWSSALPYNLGVVAIEKGAFRSPSTTVANFTIRVEELYVLPCNNVHKENHLTAYNWMNNVKKQ